MVTPSHCCDLKRNKAQSQRGNVSTRLPARWLHPAVQRHARSPELPNSQNRSSLDSDLVMRVAFDRAVNTYFMRTLREAQILLMLASQQRPCPPCPGLAGEHASRRIRDPAELLRSVLASGNSWVWAEKGSRCQRPGTCPLRLPSLLLALLSLS